ncbi:accessory factor UbiK family protein [Ketobacter sp. MCCC 1A13808]|uniref:accessory factor UbiK family protein n=1 Tax=Ketobacter sp. MCCC 1A13808 TaxID=2602738 RepID=UPI000F260790|nr:accessory factor UbiK family protein [Ketobacter sp. MCCC 1A13808]MVF14498.1 accessory factor UbiK family protein [Ketobacter sp. MCCC 1A13808]RLP55032.1 MAG: accessory factor UbiK family protein [Ketobacter sp.]
MNRQENLVNRILELISERMPQDIGEIGADLKHNLSAVIKESMSKMDLVSREEFDVQTKVLARTRARLEAMEKKLDQLERTLETGVEQQ